MRSRQRTAQVCGALKVAAVIKVVCEAGKANPRYTRTENNDTNDTERERERERVPCCKRVALRDTYISLYRLQKQSVRATHISSYMTQYKLDEGKEREREKEREKG